MSIRLLFLQKKKSDEFLFTSAKPENIEYWEDKSYELLKHSDIKSDVWSLKAKSLTKIKANIDLASNKLSKVVTAYSRGVSTGADKVFILKKYAGKYFNGFDEPVDIEENILVRPIFAKDFSAFSHSENECFLVMPYLNDRTSYTLPDEEQFKLEYPKAYNYLLRYKDNLESRKQWTKWFGYSAPRNIDKHLVADLMVPLLANKGSSALYPKSNATYCMMASGGFSLSTSVDKYLLLSLLNSSLYFFYLTLISNVFRDGWYTCTKQYFLELPFPHKIDSSIQDSLIKYSEEICQLHSKKTSISIDEQKWKLKKTLLLKEIDRLVFELFEISQQEANLINSVVYKH
ncbi:MAG: hypothetical protein R2857_02890 [Vampirovibrionales bacterium]